MNKELLTVEFRYNSKGDYKTKIITIGIFDTLESAVDKGNEVLNILSDNFQVRKEDKFKFKGLWGLPEKLVTNTCYSTKGVQYFANITTLNFYSLEDMVKNIFADINK